LNELKPAKMLLARFKPCGVCQFSYDGLVSYSLPGSD